MAQPVPLQANWSQGMKRDFARNQLPPNSAWNLVDLIINFGAPLRQRGGWAASSDASAIAGVASIRGGIYVVFATGAGGATPKNLALADNGHLINVTAAVATDIGAARTVLQNPVFHGGTRRNGTTVYTGLVIIPDGTATAVPMIYDGTTLAAMNGAPPFARYATIYKDYTVLGNGVLGGVMYPNRIWWSPTGDPDASGADSVTAWDTTDSWNDFSEPVRGFGALKSAMLIFHDDRISRIRGSNPPPDTEMVVDDPMFSIGLLDAFSICEYKDTIIWAAPEGLFRSDGVSLDDLTRKGGMLRYWLDTVPDDASGFTFAGGIVRDQYILAVLNGATFVDGFVIDLASYAWTRISNVRSTTLWSGLAGDADELYFGQRGDAQTGRLSPIFTPGVGADGNATGPQPVLPTFETPYYTLGKPGTKRFRRAYLGYRLADLGSGGFLHPEVEMSFTVDPTDNPAYTVVGGDDLAATTGYLRVRRDVNQAAPGVAFKLERLQRSAKGDLWIWDIEVEAAEREPSRVVSPA